MVTNSASRRILDRATPWAVIALLAVIAGGAYFRLVSGAPLGIDSWWRDLVEINRGSYSWAIAVFFAETGSAVGAAAMTAIAAALLLVWGERRDAGSLATAMLLGVGASELLKAIVLRPRPGGQLYAVVGSSYPSGHSMAAAALAVSLALIASAALPLVWARWAWVLAGAWILLMMWSRAALRVHWLTDTIAGALLGAAIAVLSRRLWLRGERGRKTARRR